MGRKYKNIIIIFVICIIVYLFMYPFINAYSCKNRIYNEIADKVSEEVLSANIFIIKQTKEGKITEYSIGFCGVIFKHTGDRYYAITAYHAVESVENTKLIVLASGEPTYNEYSFTQNRHIGLSEYYEQFPNAKIEYCDKKYDLAILSFESDANLNVLTLSNAKPQYREKVAVISSPSGEERNIISYGKIISRAPVEFGDEDGKTQYKVVRHSSYVNEGSSGSVVINKDLEIVGINLGGSKDVFGNFRYGMAMPSDMVNDFITKWDSK